MSEQIYKEFWNEAYKQIHQEFIDIGQEDQFKLWFNMEYVEDTLTEITVAVPSDFMWARMVSLGFKDAIQAKIAELTGQNINITYVVRKKVQQPSETPSNSAETSKSAENFSNSTGDLTRSPSSSVNSTEPVAPVKVTHPMLKENYTFDTFVTGENSTFAFNVSVAISKNPGKAYNPMLIYGGVGLGKTHLMQAIGNSIYQNNGDKLKICYISAENFTNEFTSSIRDGKIEKFKSKYRNYDVLLLDDIHFLQDKQATQEELFHTFEALDQKKAQMVFTCDRPITELKGIEDRLKTRFSRGMCIDLTPPNYETRRAILQKKLTIMGKNIPSDVVDYIAKNVQTNVRDLEGCINKMIAYAELMNKSLTLEIAQEQLRDTFSQPANGTISIETVQKVVADHYNISLSDIKGKKKNKKIVIPRQIAIYIARNLMDYSFPELGNEFGGRDHTTIMHSYEKIEAQLKIDSALDSTIQMLIREIKDYRK